MIKKSVVFLLLGTCVGFICGMGCPEGLRAQTGAAAQSAATPQEDPVRTLVGRLDLEKYKATIKALTQFGDRRQGTDRNRAASDWIEAQLKSYGCSDVARIKYEYAPAARAAGAGEAGRAAGAATGRAAGAATGRAAGAAPGGGQAAAGRGRGGANPVKGNRGPTGVNNDPTKQADVKLRELNMQPTTPGTREEVYCTKIGSTHPEEMYIVAAHMDGLGYAEGANDDASGVALVMESARILCAPDVRTDRSIRFALWNNEETGLNGARAYVEQRAPLQGKEDPPQSGKYPEPKWLGMIQHDMMLYDHGMPGPDGKLPAEQRPEADVNIEFAATAKMADSGPGTRLGRQGRQRPLCDRLPGCGWESHEQYGLRGVPGHRGCHQPARSRTLVSGRKRMGPDLAPGHRHVQHVFRQGFPSRLERDSDHAGGCSPTHGRQNREIGKASAE